jgi:hypothetical protein
VLEKTRSRSRCKIEKHLLAIPEEKRIVDHEYRQSYKDRRCEASSNGTDLCGLPCIGAHMRTGEFAGGAQKPSDDLTVGLCTSHHADQEDNPGPEWWLENVFKPQLRRKYRDWKKI